MIRKIVHIDEERCNGCGLCAEACHEGAIAMIDGKARLVRDDYCDGLGNCLPACPAGAITIIEREAAAFDEAAAKRNAEVKRVKVSLPRKLPCGCAGTNVRRLERAAATQPCSCAAEPESRLGQWPVQIKLVPVNAPYFDGARLLVAADCTAYAYAGFHERFIRERVTLVGCPKLDETDYSEKLGEIIARNDIRDITVVRMQVPCCGGLEAAVKRAVAMSGKDVPLAVTVVSLDGRLLD